MAIMAELSTNGMLTPDQLQLVLGPFPVVGLAWWQNDWHAPRCCPFPHLHQRLDMFAPLGTPVAAADGTIVAVIRTSLISGLGISLQADDGTEYFYAHLSRFAPGLHEGQRVQAGQILGQVGNTGDAAGGPTHLHFEVHPNDGSAVPPMPVVDEWLQTTLDRAQFLYQARTGHLFTDTSGQLAIWQQRAGQLVPSPAALDRERSDRSLLAQARVASAAARLPGPGPVAGGAIAAIAAGMLLVLLLGPAAVTGRRQARRAGRR